MVRATEGERTAYERELEDRVADLENAQAERVRLLKLAAAGRREYAEGAGEVIHPMPMNRLLLAEADIWDAAVKVVEGDARPLYGALPSWRWGEAGLS